MLTDCIQEQEQGKKVWCKPESMGYTLEGCKREGYTLEDCRKEGCMPEDCRKEGCRLEDCRQEGCRVEDCRQEDCMQGFRRLPWVVRMLAWVFCGGPSVVHIQTSVVCVGP